MVTLRHSSRPPGFMAVGGQAHRDVTRLHAQAATLTLAILGDDSKVSGWVRMSNTSGA